MSNQQLGILYYKNRFIALVTFVLVIITVMIAILSRTSRSYNIVANNRQQSSSSLLLVSKTQTNNNKMIKSKSTLSETDAGGGGGDTGTTTNTTTTTTTTSSSSKTASTTPNNENETTILSNEEGNQGQRRKKIQHRILAFGDSLTAGTSGYKTFPYAPYLEDALRSIRNQNEQQQQQQQETIDREVIVRYRGLPGWTATDMLNDLDGPNTGLRSAIQSITDPSLSIVIVLVGTNDLGRGHDDIQITSDIIKLHQICYDNGVPHTIAISIPSSGYQQRNEHASQLAMNVNTKLQEYCQTNNKQCTFFPFPFPYEVGGSNWYTDTLHFSEEGYKVLGESLAPVVSTILDSLEEVEEEDLNRA